MKRSLAILVIIINNHKPLSTSTLSVSIFIYKMFYNCTISTVDTNDLRRYRFVVI